LDGAEKSVPWKCLIKTKRVGYSKRFPRGNNCFECNAAAKISFFGGAVDEINDFGLFVRRSLCHQEFARSIVSTQNELFRHKINCFGNIE